MTDRAPKNGRQPAIYLSSKTKNILQFFAKETYLNGKNNDSDSLELTVGENKNAKSDKKNIYEKHTHDLGSGAILTHILKYVKNPDALFEELKTKIPWAQYSFELHGKEVQSPRLMNVMHFDRGDDHSDLPELMKIKKRVEKLTKLEFRYAVLNFYRDGNDSVAYHSDSEVSRGQTVVSVTVGDTRRFNLKHKFDKNIKYTYLLSHGDVLILNDAAIKYSYKHSVPKQKRAGPRINITFRE